MSYFYKTTVAQTVEADGLSCEIPAGVTFEDFEELQLDETFEFDPEWVALQRWWIENELRLSETYALDPKFGAFYRLLLREMDTGQNQFGLALEGPQLDTIRRLMTESLSRGEITLDYFLEKSAAITTFETALRALRS